MNNQMKITIAVAVVATALVLYMYKQNLSMRGEMEKVQEACKEANEANSELNGILQHLSDKAKVTKESDDTVNDENLSD